MRNFLLGGLALAALGVAGASPASAQAIRLDPAVSGMARSADAGVMNVQYRARYGQRYGYGYRNYGYRGRGYNRGAAVGAGIAGLAAGAIIGGAIANSYDRPAYVYEDAPVGVAGDEVSYCMQRFRSYDPRSGTYLGYDGLRHACP
ncbi:MAG: BA14K family protein [Beijerinckiaceae bacterium]|nr:BA14K family protein [Beijerinckiaceae bacterium]MDO9443348.1 BA14K family protein [Beijerinckiaceae bacterium]